jgi:hypothetical protein
MFVVNGFLLLFVVCCLVFVVWCLVFGVWCFDANLFIKYIEIPNRQNDYRLPTTDYQKVKIHFNSIIPSHWQGQLPKHFFRRAFRLFQRGAPLCPALLNALS